MKTFDYIVVGTGCSGAMVAQTLVEAGVQLAIIDVGVHNPAYDKDVPDKDFLTIRQAEKEQYKYFIGPNAEGVSLGSISKGAQITPPRHHMTDLVDKYIPIESSTFSPLESLGYGGLGIGWGLQCWEYSKVDMEQCGLEPSVMFKNYEVVSKRIGISATKDEAADYTIGQLKTYQPSPIMDRNHKLIYQNYLKHKDKFINEGFIVGRTPLALLTEDLGERKAYKYSGMDFYSDKHLSSWRPWITVNNLRKYDNLSYIENHLVIRFKEKADFVLVYCLDITSNKEVLFRCKKLILATSALGSGRIVLRSLGKQTSKLPLLSNPHTYIPYIQPSLMGKGVEIEKLGFGELSYFIDKEGSDSGLSIASSYGYQSLMLFRVANQVPLDFATALLVMRYIVSGLVIMILQHPDTPSSNKYLRFKNDPTSPTGDKLLVNYSLDASHEKQWDQREKLYMSKMHELHAYGIKRVKTEHGSSIHYGGTLPFSDHQKDLSLKKNGQVWGTKRVYVADSSGFRYLPAKGLTFSLMANAIIVAEQALKNGN